MQVFYSVPHLDYHNPILFSVFLRSHSSQSPIPLINVVWLMPDILPPPIFPYVMSYYSKFLPFYLLFLMDLHFASCRRSAYLSPGCDDGTQSRLSICSTSTTKWPTPTAWHDFQAPTVPPSSGPSRREVSFQATPNSLPGSVLTKILRNWSWTSSVQRYQFWQRFIVSE